MSETTSPVDEETVVSAGGTVRASTGVVKTTLANKAQEEEQGISIASDVVKMQGEDPATPGCLREVRVRWCVIDFQSWVRAPVARSSRNLGTVH